MREEDRGESPLHVLLRLFATGTNQVSTAQHARIAQFLRGTTRSTMTDATGTTMIGNSVERIVLNEETVVIDRNTTHVVRIVFEMNHATGHWRKLKRTLRRRSLSTSDTANTDCSSVNAKQWLPQSERDHSVPVTFLRLDENGDEVPWQQRASNIIFIDPSASVGR